MPRKNEYASRSYAFINLILLEKLYGFGKQ